MLRLVNAPTPDGFASREISAGELLDCFVGHFKHDRAKVLEAGLPHVFVGRAAGARGRYGNPFTHLDRSTAPNKVGSRKEAVESYVRWIYEPGQAALLADIRENLRRKVLLCYCQQMHERSPECHAQALARIANPDLAAEEAIEDGDSKGAPTSLELKSVPEFLAWAKGLSIHEIPRLLVTGDRNWKGTAALAAMRKVFDSLKLPLVLIEGEARGADEMARDMALEYGIPVAGFPADWNVKPGTPPHRIGVRKDGKHYDKYAGLARNQLMAECAPAQCVAFHDNIAFSRGTKDMARRAWFMGIPVTVITSSGEVTQLGRGAPNLELPYQLKDTRAQMEHTPGPSVPTIAPEQRSLEDDQLDPLEQQMLASA